MKRSAEMSQGLLEREMTHATIERGGRKASKSSDSRTVRRSLSTPRQSVGATVECIGLHLVDGI